jgi:hypothetical protein
LTLLSPTPDLVELMQLAGLHTPGRAPVPAAGGRPGGEIPEM